MTRKTSIPSPLEATLTTKRLRLIPLSRRDAPALQRSFPRWPIVQYMTQDVIPWPYPDHGATDFINAMLPKMATGETYIWGIHLKGRNRHWPIGVVEIRTTDDRDHAGFWLAESHWGNGYMREAVFAAYDFAFDVLKMKKIKVLNDERNSASHNIQKACNARFIGRVAAASMAGPAYDEMWEVTPELFKNRSRHRVKRRTV